MNVLVGHKQVKKSDCVDVTQMSEQDPEAEHTPSSEELNNDIPSQQLLTTVMTSVCSL